jgi:hypothetical protein
MKSDPALWDICMDIYRELYRKAEPPRDFDDIITSGEGKIPLWFQKYYLDQKIQDNIIECHIKKHKLTEYESSKIHFEMYLGCSPLGIKHIKTRKA